MDWCETRTVLRVKLSTHKAGTDSSLGVQVGDGAVPHWADQGLGEEEDHFCRGCRVSSTGKNRGMRGKMVTAKELRGAIKAGCADFDLLVEVFGSKSMRKTMATDDRLKGVGQEETNQKGSWSGKGSTCSRHYTPRARGWPRARA